MGDAWEAIRFGRRRVWSNAQRAYIEVHRVEVEHERFAKALETELKAVRGVQWVRLNAPLGRVVVASEGGDFDRDDWVDAVDRVERRFGFSRAPNWRDRRPFAGEQEPLLRFAVETTTDLVGFTTSVVLRLLSTKTVPGGIDISALLSVMESVPQIGRWIARRIGANATDLLFNILDMVSASMVQGLTGPFVDVFRRALDMREAIARLRTWGELEPLLGGQPDAHDVAWTDEDRVVPLPRGPVERYASQAVSASGAAFGFSFVATRDPESSTVPLFSGLPKPAVLGREAFAAELGHLLARRGIVVMDPRVLRTFDRVDTVVVPSEILRPRVSRVDQFVILGGFNERDARRNVMRLIDLSDPAAVHRDDKWWLGPWTELPQPRTSEVEQEMSALRSKTVLALRHEEDVVALVSLVPMTDPLVEALVAAVERAELELVCMGDGAEHGGSVRPNRFVPGGAEALESIRSLQRDGHCVCFLAQGPHDAFTVADVGIGLHDDGSRPPWGASFLCRHGLTDASLVVEALRAARDASTQSVYLAMVEAASGLILSVGGLRSTTVRRVMLAANATSTLAMLNAMRIARSVRVSSGARRRDPTPWHALDVDQVLDRLGTTKQGLAPSEAAARARPRPQQPSPLSRFMDTVVAELANPFAPVLAAGAGLSALTGSAVDASMIAGVVGLNATVGAVQRYRTDRALESLDASDQPVARVLRAGNIAELTPDEVVLGDILVLEAGDSVSADARIVEARGLELDESSLTGESLPVTKSASASFATAVADRTSMVFEGTVVAAGTCLAAVTAAGEDTEARRAVVRPTHERGIGVEARLEALTNFTAPIAALSGVALMTAGLALDRPAREVISSGVSLSVAAVPEGLPLLATMAQLAVARRLSKRHALVRNPRAIEALGRTDVLCCDKTGTLTEGRISLRFVGDGTREAPIERLEEELEPVLRTALRAGPSGRSASLPHATDRALVEGAHAAGLHRHRDTTFEVLHELPFEPARGFHAVFGRSHDEHSIAVKGAPEHLISRCTHRRSLGTTEFLEDAGRDALMREAHRLADRGLRVLAVAERSMEARDHIADRHVTDLTFLGYVAFADPIRQTAKQAVDAIRRAGVDVMMITGDHPTTALAIARELGLPDGEGALTGPELDALDDESLDARIERTVVFARVTPSQKVRIVESLRRRNRTVAMTGDGANDAPAIRLSDVGIAMGPEATPGARRAADIVVTDERIETVVDAVLEGRALWRSVRDAVAVLVGGNLGEIGFTVLGGLVEGRSPLNARQLLVVNLLTDTLPALAIALRRPSRTDPEQMLREGPEASLGSALDRDIAWRATVTGAATTAAWLSSRVIGTRKRADTVALLTLVGSQLGQTLALGWRDPTVLAAGLGSVAILLGLVETPGVSHFFGSRPLGPIGLLQASTASVAATVTTVLGPRIAAGSRRLWIHLSGESDEPTNPSTLEQVPIEPHSPGLGTLQ